MMLKTWRALGSGPVPTHFVGSGLIVIAATLSEPRRLRALLITDGAQSRPREIPKRINATHCAFPFAPVACQPLTAQGLGLFLPPLMLPGTGHV